MKINEDGSVTVSQEQLKQWADEKTELARKALEFEAQALECKADIAKLMTSLGPVMQMLGLGDPNAKQPSTMKLMQSIPKLLNNPNGMFNGMGEVLEKYAHLIVNPVKS